MRDVYVAGIGMARFAKQPDRTLKTSPPRPSTPC